MHNSVSRKMLNFRRRRLGKDRRGVAAVEFAILLPFMAVLYLGTFEVAQVIGIYRMVEQTASTVANLVTQYTQISSSQQMPDILNASAAVLTPYRAANATVVVSCIAIDGSGNAKVAWSQALNGTARPVGQAMALPAAFDVPNTSVVYGEATYNYSPVIDFLNAGSLQPHAAVFMLPRSSTSITLTP